MFNEVQLPEERRAADLMSIFQNSEAKGRVDKQGSLGGASTYQLTRQADGNYHLMCLVITEQSNGKLYTTNHFDINSDGEIIKESAFVIGDESIDKTKLAEDFKMKNATFDLPKGKVNIDCDFVLADILARNRD